MRATAPLVLLSLGKKYIIEFLHTSFCLEVITSVAADAPSPSYLPWDTTAGNRFSHYTDEDHSAPIWVAALLGILYTLGILILRAFIKRRVFGWDDYLVVAASVLATGQFILICIALRNGLGKINEHVADLEIVGKLGSAARLLWLIALYLTKLSVLSLLHMLLIRDQQIIKMIWVICFGFTIVSGLVSVLFSMIVCPVSGLFIDHCNLQETRWTLVTALDVATESLVLILVPYMIWRLQMKVGNKLRVIAAFSFRLMTIAFSIVQLDAWIAYSDGPPSTFLIANTIIWQQILLTVSLVTATIPNLKAFLQSLSAGWGEPDFGYSRRTYGNGTYELKSWQSGNNMAHTSTSQSQRGKQGASNLRPQFSTSSSWRLSDRPSGESQDLIIRKETELRIELE